MTNRPLLIPWEEWTRILLGRKGKGYDAGRRPVRVYQSLESQRNLRRVSRDEADPGFEDAVRAYEDDR